MIARTRSPWLVVLLCATVGLGAMGLITMTALSLDEQDRSVRGQAEMWGNVRLALWRMEFTLSQIVTQETAWPYFFYEAFYPAAVDARVKLGGTRVGVADQERVPSPLLTQRSPDVILHFRVDPQGQFSSPQVPSKEMQKSATMLFVSPDSLKENRRRLNDLQRLLSFGEVAAALPENEPKPPSIQACLDQQSAQAVAKSQSFRNDVEWAARRGFADDPIYMACPAPDSCSAIDLVSESTPRCVWLGGALLLVRRVSVDGSGFVQGAWLDWNRIRARLLERVKDLLPNARLEPVTDVITAHAEGQQVLATAPVRVIPGDIEFGAEPILSPVRASLLIAWGGGLVAAAAIVVLLLGTVALSERRAAFVSAVTHELRTPLTTFRLYTEMLADNMVTEPDKRQRYLEKLRVESDRLGHLVENVLAYSRLEGSSPGATGVPVRLCSMLEDFEERLADRAREVKMQLAVHLERVRDTAYVKADPSAVERILFNLVDNACKYAAGAIDRRIHVEADVEGQHVCVRVRDHGPGIDSREARWLFRPFTKSDRDAANSAPGIGLGLALSRRLARRMGGDLDVTPQRAEGTCFVLKLPMAPAAG